MSISKVQLSRWEESRGVLLGLLARYPYGDEGEAEYLTDAVTLFYLTLGYTMKKGTVIGNQNIPKRDKVNDYKEGRPVLYFREKEESGIERAILPLITHLMTPVDEDWVGAEHVLRDIKTLENRMRSCAYIEQNIEYKECLEHCRSILKDEFTVFTPLKEEDYCCCLTCGKPVFVMEGEDV